MTASTAILVLSCDKYADIWPVFFEFFHKYWDDCPFPVYLGANEKTYTSDKVKQVFSKKQSTWSEELSVILKQIPEKYVILILEDYLIYKSVNNGDIYKIINVMDHHKAAYMRLAAFPKKYDELWPTQALTDTSGFGAIQKGSMYRLCLQTAIWNKSILSELLVSSESPWEFEINGSKRSDLLENPFLCVLADPTEKIVHGPIHYYCTALSAGRWMRGAIRLCKKENIPVDLSIREVESVFEELLRKLYISFPIKIRKVLDYGKHKIMSK